MHVSGAVQVPPFSHGLEHKAEINILSSKAKEVPGLKHGLKVIYTAIFYSVNLVTTVPEISILVDSNNLRVAPGYLQYSASDSASEG